MQNKIKILVFTLLLNSMVYPQWNTLDSLKSIVNEIDSTANLLPLKISWNYYPADPSADGIKVLWYNIYRVAGNDTTKFPFWIGSKESDINNGFLVSDWQAGQTYTNYFYIKLHKNVKYNRIGIIGIDKDGKHTDMFFCKTIEN